MYLIIHCDMIDPREYHAVLGLLMPTTVWGEPGIPRLLSGRLELHIELSYLSTVCQFYDREIREFAEDIRRLETGEVSKATLVSEDNTSWLALEPVEGSDDRIAMAGEFHTAGSEVFLREEVPEISPQISHCRYAFGGLAFPRSELPRIRSKLEEMLATL